MALGQGALMLFGGLLAVLVAQIFGKNARTDAFFAAYGVYAVGLTFGQTFRLTAVSRLMHAKGSDPVTRLLGAVIVMALLVGVPMVAFAGPLGRLLVTSDPGGIATTTLRVLWLALAGQLLAAMLSTVLAVRGAFMAIGLATLASGCLSVGAFLLLEPGLGIPAAAVGLALSALWLTAAFSVVLLRAGWRATSITTADAREMCREAVRLVFSSSIFIAMNLAYVICVALASRQGGGETTLFAYAYVLAAVLIGLTANVTGMVRSPALLASDRRALDIAAAGISSFRFTVVLAGPVLAMAMLVGRPIVSTALGSGFTGHDVHRILVTLLCLVGWVLGSAASIFATIELLARGELRLLAKLSAAVIMATFVLGLGGAALAGIEGIAVGLSVTILGMSLVELRWAFGRDGLHAARQMGEATARELAVILLAFAPSFVLVSVVGDTAPAMAIAGAVAAVLAMLVSRLAWPREWQVLLLLVRRPTDRSVSAIAASSDA